MDVPASIIEACKRAEPEAFEELVRLTHRDVYSLALRLVGNPEDAAEVSQETYMKVLKSIRTFRGDSKFSTWLYRVASNAAITSLRRQGPRRLDVALETQEWHQIPAPATADPAVAVERGHLRQRLEAAVASLPTGYRAVVVMKDVYGQSLQEIGKQLGITEGAAKVRLFRARRRLREMLYDEDQAAPEAPGKAHHGLP